ERKRSFLSRLFNVEEVPPASGTETDEARTRGQLAAAPREELEQLPTDAAITPPPSTPASAAAPPEPPPRQSWLQRLKAGLSRSSQSLASGITGVFTKKRLDRATLDELEDLLIQADLGVVTAA